MNAEITAKKCNLPFYSEGEEIFHVASHAFGVLYGIAMISIVSLNHQNATQLISGVLFGLSLIILYAVSCTYHGLYFLYFGQCSTLRLLLSVYLSVLIKRIGQKH